MAQTLKQLRDSGMKFPPYENDFASGDGIRKLGPLQAPTRLT
jgi:hypothetical protein